MEMIYYDFRRLGAFRYIPPGLICILSLLCAHSKAEEIVILKSMELFLTPLVTWWIVPCFFDYVNEDTREAYLSYPYSRYLSGVCRILFWTSIYCILLAIAFFIAVDNRKEYGIYCLIFAIQVFFYACAAFFLIVYTRNIVLSFGVIWGYAGIQVLDVNHRFSGISVCFYDVYHNGLPVMVLKGVVIIVASIVFMIYAQKAFNKMSV